MMLYKNEWMLKLERKRQPSILRRGCSDILKNYRIDLHVLIKDEVRTQKYNRQFFRRGCFYILKNSRIDLHVLIKNDVRTQKYKTRIL